MIFSKLYYKSVFCQLELHRDSLYFTVFLANNKLYCYTHLIMGVKPAQSELNSPLRPRVHISYVFLIQNNLKIATEMTSQHKRTLLEVMEII